MKAMSALRAKLCTRHRSAGPSFRAAAFVLLVTAALVWSAGCSRGEQETEPTVSVQVAPAQRTTIQRLVRSDAILFPIDQASITPKISAPVKEFRVNRGSAVHKGELLAVLENRDLAAAEEE